MKDLAPQIVRQRLLIEGYTSGVLTRDGIEAYLGGLAAHLGLRAYGAPAIFSPGGEGKAENQGFDAFLPLIDSGIAVYYWSSQRFVSVFLYTCKRFDDAAAIAYTRAQLGVAGEVATAAI